MPIPADEESAAGRGRGVVVDGDVLAVHKFELFIFVSLIQVLVSPSLYRHWLDSPHRE